MCLNCSSCSDSAAAEWRRVRAQQHPRDGDRSNRRRCGEGKSDAGEDAGQQGRAHRVEVSSNSETMRPR